MSSDNRAAFALARTYPGGLDGFRLAVRNKGMAIGLRRTNIEEPTGLSPHNTSTATDLARLVMAAGRYPEIERLTTCAQGRPLELLRAVYLPQYFRLSISLTRRHS